MGENDRPDKLGVVFAYHLSNPPSIACGEEYSGASEVPRVRAIIDEIFSWRLKVPDPEQVIIVAPDGQIRGVWRRKVY